MTTGIMADAGRSTKDGLPWKRTLAMVVVGIALVLYFAGRLDYALYPVGLNFHPCARNGIGATFCGSDLTAYQQRWRDVQQQIATYQQQATTAECQADPALSFCTQPTAP